MGHDNWGPDRVGNPARTVTDGGVVAGIDKRQRQDDRQIRTDQAVVTWDGSGTGYVLTATADLDDSNPVVTCSWTPPASVSSYIATARGYVDVTGGTSGLLIWAELSNYSYVSTGAHGPFYPPNGSTLAAQTVGPELVVAGHPTGVQFRWEGNAPGSVGVCRAAITFTPLQ